MNITEQFEHMYTTVNLLKDQLQSFQKQLKALEKDVKKRARKVDKATSVSADAAAKPRKPSGFATPSKVSNELCMFLNKTEGTEIARTEVTKAVVSYIKENGLQSNAAKKNIIMPDEKLKMLLGIGDEQELTYFSLQKYMNKHFIKTNDATI